MNGTELWEKMELLDDELIEESRVPPKRKTFWPLIAACLALVFVLGAILLWHSEVPVQVQRPSGSSALPGSSGVPPTAGQETLPSFSVPITTPSQPQDPFGPGSVAFLSADLAMGTAYLGQGIKQIQFGSGPDMPSPYNFDLKGILVTAEVQEILSARYSPLQSTMSQFGETYYLYRMKVVDPMDGGMSGEFWLANSGPKKLAGDILILSLVQKGNPYAMKNQSSNKVELFENLYMQMEDYFTLTFNTLTFRNGLLLEDYPQDSVIPLTYGVPYSKHQLEDDMIVVPAASSVEEALAAIDQAKKQLGSQYTATTPAIEPTPSAEVMLVLEYTGSFDNGVFQRERKADGELEIRRYINACPTNEVYRISADRQTLTRPVYTFEETDCKLLMDGSSFLEKLKLKSLASPAEEEILFPAKCAGIAAYEKTASGVVSYIKVEWAYTRIWPAKYNFYYSYILLDEAGAHFMTEAEMEAYLAKCNQI